MRIFIKLLQYIFKVSPMILGAGLVLGIHFNSFAQRTITYNSGSGNFVVPFKTTSVTAEVWGAGGKGGNTTNNNARGGGGGGGAYSLGIISSLTPSNNLAYQVGIGSNSTAQGGDSFVGSTTTVMAKGGNSVAINITSGALGGLASAGFGTTKFNGGIGADGGASNGGGGGGSSGGTGANGNYTIATIAIAGATAPAGGGNGANGAPSPNNNGTTATQFGGGGGGSSRGSGGSAVNGTGGNGANGQVKISWSCSSSLVSGNPNPAPVCLGTGIGPIVYDFTGATNYNINWAPSVPSGISVTADANAGTITIQGVPTSTGTFSYTISPTYPATSTGTCSGPTSFSGSFTVTPNNTAGTITSNTFCQGSALGVVTQSTTGATGIGAASGLPPGVTVGWAANQITFSGTPTTPGSYTYSIPMTGGCGVVNATGTITVNATPAILTPNLSPAGQTRCISGAAFGQISVGTGYGYTYQWYSNTTNDNTTGTAISGAISNTYTPLNTTAGTLYYYVVVSSPSCNSVTSPVSGAFTVTPNNTATAASSSPVVCVNPAVPINITHTTSGATGIGAISWSPSNPGGMSASLSGTTLTVSGTPTQSGVFNYSIPLTGGCGAVSATGTITVNALPAAIATSSFLTQSRCINASPAFNPLSVQARTGFSYQWYRNTTGTIDTSVDIPVGTDSNSFTPPNDGSAPTPSRYYVVVSSTTSCGTPAISTLSGDFVVNPLPVVSFIDQPAGPNVCVDTDVTYQTQGGQSNYNWVIPGILGTDYTITSGGHSGSSFIVLQWKTPGSKSISVNYTDANSCGATTPATSNSVNVIKNTVTASSDPHPSSCFIDRTITSFTHTTTLATGIGTPTGLPLGLSATFSLGNTITISGTVAASVLPGIYNYSIPLTGGCGTVAATGFIDVQPEYQLTKITSVSPSVVGGTATITIEGDPSIFTNGTYDITYSLGLSNAGTETKTVTFVNGKAVFSSLTIASEDLTSLTVSQIKKTTDDCFVPLSLNNITFFGIKAATFTTNDTFYVPAGIYEITIKVWGGGGAGGNGNNGAGGGGGGYSVRTISVVPGEPIGIFIGSGGSNQGNGGPSYATRDSSDPNPITSSLVYSYGGNGANGQTIGTGGNGITFTGSNGLPGNGLSGNAQIGGKGGNGGGPTGGLGGNGGAGSGNRPGIAGERPGGGGGGGKGSNGGNGGAGLVLISYPLPPVGPCFKVIDDGAISGTTIIEFTCNTTWSPPQGLLEFRTFVGGAGGGGGSGSGAGGGGAGGLISGIVPSGNPIGFPANNTFTINVGQGGSGAPNPNVRGTTGSPSSLTGTVNGSTITFTAGGGGGGGSENQISGLNGTNGASGGGGGANNLAEGVGGTGSGSGKSGGLGDFSTAQAFAGGGGGGIAEIGGEGKGAGLGQGEGGKGGNGISVTLGDSTRYFGAGGGGVGFNFNGTQKIGFGGTAPNGSKIGGDGNLTGTNPAGVPGVDKTGSGGGAGYGTGGKGGNGIVYIYYLNFTILDVEYQYFNAKFNPQTKSGDLTWATSKEWENSHFEIERAVNDVKTWTKVGEVKGAGYSDSPVEYSFTDTNLPASGGNIFYRLKQVDLDGDFGYSVTKAIQVEGLKGTTSWIAYPNPSNLGSQVTIDLLNSSEFIGGTIQIRVSDVRGVYESYSVSKPEEVSSAVNSYLEKARQGMYIVQLFWGDKSEQIKLVRK